MLKKKQNSKLKIIPLGGLEQIGMNITAFEYEDSIIVVDCGLSFPASSPRARSAGSAWDGSFSPRPIIINPKKE